MAEGKWWVYGEVDGKMVILGGYSTSEKADNIICSAFDGMGEKILLETIDKSRAAQIIKHKRFEETGDLRYSLRPAKHTLGRSDESEEE